MLKAISQHIKTYYPFGMIMPERSYAATAQGYRFGFNGQEQDAEVSGNDGDYLDFGARIYDSRLGTWLSVDPLQKKYPNYSPYCFTANNPIYYIDVDGKEFVNPYATDRDDAQCALEMAQDKYDQFVETHGTKRLSKELKAEMKQLKSQLKDANRSFNTLDSKYQEVNNYIYTLKVTNPSEFDYFNTLTDANGNEIDILVKLDNMSAGTNVATVEGLAYFDMGEGKIVPTGRDGTLSIILYKKNNQKNSGVNADLTSQATESGRNYESFANELGDIQFYFNTVVDETTKDFFENTTSADDPGYNDPKGAGQYSFDYENNRIEDFKNYTPNQNPTNGPIVKKHPINNTVIPQYD